MSKVQKSGNTLIYVSQWYVKRFLEGIPYLYFSTSVCTCLKIKLILHSKYQVFHDSSVGLLSLPVHMNSLLSTVLPNTAHHFSSLSFSHCKLIQRFLANSAWLQDKVNCLSFWLQSAIGFSFLHSCSQIHAIFSNSNNFNIAQNICQ